MFRIVAVSVRGPKYLIGNPSVHPIGAVPPTVGKRFANLDQVRHYVADEFATLTVYWRVEVVDEHGAVVMRGTRDGYNGTGPGWIWEPPPSGR